MECYNSGMNNKEAAGCHDAERINGRLLREQIIEKIQQANSGEIDNIVQWMCDNPSVEWLAVIYEVSHLSDFPVKDIFMSKIDAIYESCSEVVADSDGQVDVNWRWRRKKWVTQCAERPETGLAIVMVAAGLEDDLAILV